MVEEFVVPELEPFVGETRNKKWTPYEENVLKTYYGKVPAEKISEYLGRTLTSILNKARNMGIRSEYKHFFECDKNGERYS
jgi:transcriptional regulator of aromatic amino acid metabolism